MGLSNYFITLEIYWLMTNYMPRLVILDYPEYWLRRTLITNSVMWPNFLLNGWLWSPSSIESSPLLVMVNTVYLNVSMLMGMTKELHQIRENYILFFISVELWCCIVGDILIRKDTLQGL